MGNPMEAPASESVEYTTYKEVADRYNYLGEEIRKFNERGVNASDFNEDNIKAAEEEFQVIAEKLETLKEEK
jgi:hypothetical protein